MSYCVNCGVELHEAERKCPLCGTPVVNPNHPFDENAVPAYPKNVDYVTLQKERKTTALLISVILAVPASICLVCNYIISGAFTWSVYVLAALVLVWVLIVPPCVIKRSVVFWSLVLDVLAVGGFLYVVSLVALSERDWFRQLALPILAAAAAVIFVLAAVFEYSSMARLHKFALFFVLVGVFLIIIEVITDPYIGQPVSLSWSLFAMIPCAAVAAIYMIVERKKKLKNSLKKRLHM